MDILFDFIISFFKTVSAPTALFAVIDKTIDKKKREIVSDYLFGRNTVNFEDFERNLIQGLMSFFMRNGHLSSRRIILISSLLSLLGLGVMILIYPNQLMVTDYSISANVLFLFLTTVTVSFFVSLTTHAFDRFSLAITKWLFLDRSPKFPKSGLYILLDIFLSTAAFLFAAIIVFFINAFQNLSSGQSTIIPTAFIIDR